MSRINKLYTKHVGDIPYNYTAANLDTFVDEETVRRRWWYPNIKQGDVIVDVGACFGSYLLPALALGATAIAFSPESEAEYEAMVENVKLNEGFIDRAVCIFQAFYNKEGWLHFVSQDFSYERPRPLWKDGYIHHPVTTFDKFMEKEGSLVTKIDFMKVDVEGAEVEFVEGAMATIQKYKPKMLIENHLFKDGLLQEKIIAMIDNLGLGYKNESAPYHSISHTYFWIE